MSSNASRGKLLVIQKSGATFRTRKEAPAMPWHRRRDLIDHSTVGAYHCFSRCVRRAFLCGEDVSGLDLGHRRDWVRERLEALASVFAIDICDHAVMDNHLHVILRNRPDLVPRWSDEEVARRWLRLSRRSLELRPEPRPKRVRKLAKDAERIKELRFRLSNISWFMLMLNEPIARTANSEDEVSGHFFGERFGSVRLEDLEQLLLCSLYVDLNPVRAGLATTPEDSKYTGACDRIQDRQEQAALEAAARERGGPGEFNLKELLTRKYAGWMAPLWEGGDGYDGVAAGRRASNKGYLPLQLDKYLQLLDEVGRELAPGKSGAIPEELPPILERLGLDRVRWGEAVLKAARCFDRIAQKAEALRLEARRHGRP